MSETPDRGGDETVEIRPAEPTVELPTPSLPRFHPSVWLLFVAVAAAGLLAGIGFAATTRGGPTGALVAEATVGRGGGTLTFDGKGVLRIPSGALRSPVRVAVRRSVVDERLRVHPPEGPLYVFERKRLLAYTFEPAGVTFMRPVTIVLPLQEARRAGTVFSYVDGSVLFFGGEVDPEEATIAIEVFDFRFRAGRAPGAEQ